MNFNIKLGQSPKSDISYFHYLNFSNYKIWTKRLFGSNPSHRYRDVMLSRQGLSYYFGPMRVKKLITT